jgi:threonyl-tRNA synthetase
MACSGQNKNSPTTPNNQNTDANKALILGHWVSDCYPDAANDFAVEASAQDEYWFYENKYVHSTKHFNDNICQTEGDFMVFNWRTGMLEKPLLKASYNFSKIETAKSGETFSVYKSTSTDEESQSPLSNIGWEFGVYIKANTLYIAGADLEGSGGFKINFNRPFHKKSDLTTEAK